MTTAATASTSFLVAGGFLFFAGRLSGVELFGPLFGPLIHRREQLQERKPALGQRIAIGATHDQMRLAQLPQTQVQDRGRNIVTGRLQGSKGQGLAAELPENTEHPTATQQIEQDHDRPATARPPHKETKST